MHLPRAVLASCLLTLPCLSCADEDTILALNVDSKAEVGAVDQLEVTVSQTGKAPFQFTFAPPLKQEKDASPSIDEDFFERITLPGSFESGPIVVAVRAENRAGRTFMDQTMVQLHAGEATAAFIELGMDPPPEPKVEETDSGSNDAGNDAGADADGGADSGADGG